MNLDIFPIVCEDFLTKEARNHLLNWIENNSLLFNQHESSITYWNKKCIYFHAIDNKDIRNILYQSVNGMLQFIKVNVPSYEFVYVEPPQLVRWREGDEMTPHADNIEQDGITPNSSPHRTYGGVIYLNHDFKGGEIYYPNLNIQVSPKPGMVVIHPAGLRYTHGVKKINYGTRYTISTFFTDIQSYSIENHYP